MSISSLAQEEKDNVNETDTISLYEFNTLKEERDSAVQNYNSLLHLYNAVCKRDSMNSIRIDSLQTSLNYLNANNENVNKKLANIASNFLYIPYEAYSIEKIAIPAFEAISLSSLRKKNEIKYTLLKNYQQDILSLLNFIHETKESFNNPFASKTSDTKNLYINKLHAQNFYKTYIQYSDWKSTYLGKKITKIESILVNSNGAKKPNFDEIENELSNCLKSIEGI